MKALSLIRPWAWTFFFPPEPYRKHLENRVWKPPESIIDTRVAFHSGRKIDKDDIEYIINAIPGCQALPSWARAFDEGIIGTVVIRGWLHNEGLFPTHYPPRLNVPGPGQKIWFFGPYAMVTEDERVLATPIPCKGALGFWDVPPDIERQIIEQGGADGVQRADGRTG